MKTLESSEFDKIGHYSYLIKLINNAIIFYSKSDSTITMNGTFEIENLKEILNDLKSEDPGRMLYRNNSIIDFHKINLPD